MKQLVAAILVSVFLHASADAQHVIFEEDFEEGIPTSWTNIQLDYLGDIWQPGFDLVDGTGDVNHEWFCDFGGVHRDNILVSPMIDLSGVTQAFFECSQWQVFPESREYNAILVTTDGGATHDVVYEETGAWTGFGTIKVDLSAYVGMSGVQVALHYKGTIANDWSVDNIRITTSPLAYEITNLVAGQTARFLVTGAGPGNEVQMILSVAGAGPLPTPFGNLNLSGPVNFLPTVVADANGDAELNIPIPLTAGGLTLYSQAVEFDSTTRISNALAMMVQ